MSIPFITRKPTRDEVLLLRLCLSTYCDGSGMETLESGGTAPGWREMERCVAEVLRGTAPEGKQIFDVFVPSTRRRGVVYGVSVKTRTLTGKDAIESLAAKGRVYLELSNSLAKFRNALQAKGITEADLRARRRPDVVGNCVLQLVESWHEADAAKFAAKNAGKRIDLQRSVYLTISKSAQRAGRPPRYQMHSFGLALPKPIAWRYTSEKCLRGFDPSQPGEALFDWYGLSGGQLKYYPQAGAARYSSRPFELLLPHVRTIRGQAARYWPREFLAAGGEYVISPADTASEMDQIALLQANRQAAAVLRHAAQELRRLGP